MREAGGAWPRLSSQWAGLAVGRDPLWAILFVCDRGPRGEAAKAALAKGALTRIACQPGTPQYKGLHEYLSRYGTR